MYNIERYYSWWTTKRSIKTHVDFPATEFLISDIIGAPLATPTFRSSARNPRMPCWTHYHTNCKQSSTRRFIGPPGVSAIKRPPGPTDYIHANLPLSLSLSLSVSLSLSLFLSQHPHSSGQPLVSGPISPRRIQCSTPSDIEETVRPNGRKSRAELCVACSLGEVSSIGENWTVSWWIDW